MRAPSLREQTDAATWAKAEVARGWLDPARDSAGLYVRFGQPLFRALLIVVVLPPALVLGLVIALVNALQFRSLRQVLFRQQRVGRGGQVFWIYKFRTMRESPGRDYDSWRSGEDRLRVTPCGGFLRNTHLDELPQILNILRGEMDFIGPRPEMLDIHAWACRHIRGFEQRTLVRPGITGLAQVTMGYAGREVRLYRRKWLLDRRYIGEQSLTLDLQILARTTLWMLQGRGWIRDSTGR